MSQVFDPMGYVLPFFLPIKKLMQRLCQMNMTWDDPVPEEMEQWRHVDKKRNPADIASRGLMPNEIRKAKLWFHGPEFLWNADGQWPARPSSLPPLPDQLIYSHNRRQQFQQAPKTLLTVPQTARFDIDNGNGRGHKGNGQTRSNGVISSRNQDTGEVSGRELTQPIQGGNGREPGIVEHYMYWHPSEKFWIVRGHSAVWYYLKRCLPCRVWKAKTGEQLMAPLPGARVTPGNRPFTNTGVDYMGPNGETRTFSNRWGSSTKKIFSDNGSNFVGAERELHQGIQRWNKKQIHEFLCQKSIDWHFNPPLSSHQGRVWERMIRSVRKTLRSIAGEKVLDDESLVTFMSEVESIINNRPLTPVSDVPDDLSAPMSILAGSLEPSLPPDEFLKADGYRRSWRFDQLLANQFWQRWMKDNLPLLQQRQKWLQPTPNFKTGDIVLMVDENTKRGHWPKERRRIQTRIGL
ncbi:uncharacterized protein LOC143462182 [Clavelina lepadiformis]|uniref:uncharacterized protein LOC143462182 n=1 Tax=Clavelina lepadiformis TaxID=159417 RepID=UPI0040419293